MSNEGEWRHPVYKLIEEARALSPEKGGILEAIKNGQITRKELLDRSRKNGTYVTIYMSRWLKEALNEFIVKLRELGYDFKSLNDFVCKLLTDLILASLNAKQTELEGSPALVINISLSPREPYIYNSPSGRPYGRPYGIPDEKSNIGSKGLPDELKAIIRKAIEKMQETRYMDRENKIAILEPILEKLQRYKDYPIAQYYIAAIEYELSSG